MVEAAVEEAALVEAAMEKAAAVEAAVEEAAVEGAVGEAAVEAVGWGWQAAYAQHIWASSCGLHSAARAAACRARPSSSGRERLPNVAYAHAVCSQRQGGGKGRQRWQGRPAWQVRQRGRWSGQGQGGWGQVV